MAIYDLVFNQGQGLNSLINVYLAVYPNTNGREFHLTDLDLKFIQNTLEPYPNTTTSIYELTQREGLTPVTQFDTAKRIVLYTGGIPVVVIALDPQLPDSATQSIYYYFKGYENPISPLSLTTQESAKPWWEL
jgi:hypothetical protein